MKNIKCYSRFLNAVPNSKFDIYINDVLYKKSIEYKTFTEYDTAKEGTYNIQLTKVNDKSKILYQLPLKVEKEKIYTFAITKKGDQLNILTVEDYLKPSPKIYNWARVRFINLSPSDTSFDFLLDDVIKADDLSYCDITFTELIQSKKYVLRVLDSYSGNQVSAHKNLILKPYREFSFFLVGNSNNKYEVLIPLEGASYLKF